MLTTIAATTTIAPSIPGWELHPIGLTTFWKMSEAEWEEFNPALQRPTDAVYAGDRRPCVKLTGLKSRAS